MTANQEIRALLLLRYGPPPRIDDGTSYAVYHDRKDTWLSNLPQEFLIRTGYVDTDGSRSMLGLIVGADVAFSRLVDWAERNPGRF